MWCWVSLLWSVCAEVLWCGPVSKARPPPAPWQGSVGSLLPRDGADLTSLPACPTPCAAPACLPPPRLPRLQPTSMAVGQGHVAAGGQNSQLDVRRLAGGQVVYKGHVGGSVNNALHIARDSGHQVGGWAGGRAGGWAGGQAGSADCVAVLPPRASLPAPSPSTTPHLLCTQKSTTPTPAPPCCCRCACLCATTTTQ